MCFCDHCAGIFHYTLHEVLHLRQCSTGSEQRCADSPTEQQTTTLTTSIHSATTTYIPKLPNMSHDPPSQKRMRSLSRSRFFTYFHYTRNPSYTVTTRQKMSEDRATYLENLGRWLDYELDSPEVADGAAVTLAKPKPSPAPTSADSLIEDERRKMASDVAERNQREGACNAKCDADLEEVKNMPIVAPLPSCARDEEGEGDAGRWMEGNDGLVDTVTKKVMAVLGLGEER